MNIRKIFLKPHHFLDVIKLYGAGIEKFIPDENCGHGFYRVGNLILKNPKIVIHLTARGDDICKPCKFFKKGKCTDLLIETLGYHSRQKWNETIDKRIFKRLGLKESVELTAIEFCQLAKEKLKIEDIRKIWEERPAKETEDRIKSLLKGFDKYTRKCLLYIS